MDACIAPVFFVWSDYHVSECSYKWLPFVLLWLLIKEFLIWSACSVVFVADCSRYAAVQFLCGCCWFTRRSWKLIVVGLILLTIGLAFVVAGGVVTGIVLRPFVATMLNPFAKQLLEFWFDWGVVGWYDVEHEAHVCAWESNERNYRLGVTFDNPIYAVQLPLSIKLHSESHHVPLHQRWICGHLLHLPNLPLPEVELPQVVKHLANWLPSQLAWAFRLRLPTMFSPEFVAMCWLGFCVFCVCLFLGFIFFLCCYISTHKQYVRMIAPDLPSRLTPNRLRAQFHEHVDLAIYPEHKVGEHRRLAFEREYVEAWCIDQLMGAFPRYRDVGGNTRRWPELGFRKHVCRPILDGADIFRNTKEPSPFEECYQKGQLCPEMMRIPPAIFTHSDYYLSVDELAKTIKGPTFIINHSFEGDHGSFSPIPGTEDSFEATWRRFGNFVEMRPDGGTQYRHMTHEWKDEGMIVSSSGAHCYVRVGTLGSTQCYFAYPAKCKVAVEDPTALCTYKVSQEQILDDGHVYRREENEFVIRIGDDVERRFPVSVVEKTASAVYAMPRRSEKEYNSFIAAIRGLSIPKLTAMGVDTDLLPQIILLCIRQCDKMNVLLANNKSYFDGPLHSYGFINRKSMMLRYWILKKVEPYLHHPWEYVIRPSLDKVLAPWAYDWCCVPTYEVLVSPNKTKLTDKVRRPVEKPFRDVRQAAITTSDDSDSGRACPDKQQRGRVNGAKSTEGSSTAEPSIDIAERGFWQANDESSKHRPPAREEPTRKAKVVNNREQCAARVTEGIREARRDQSEPVVNADPKPGTVRRCWSEKPSRLEDGVCYEFVGPSGSASAPHCADLIAHAVRGTDYVDVAFFGGRYGGTRQGVLTRDGFGRLWKDLRTGLQNRWTSSTMYRYIDRHWVPIDCPEVDDPISALTANEVAPTPPRTNTVREMGTEVSAEEKGAVGGCEGGSDDGVDAGEEGRVSEVFLEDGGVHEDDGSTEHITEN